MAKKVFTLSENKYRELQRKIRSIEQINPAVLYRRYPVFSGGSGGGIWPLPTGTVSFSSTSSRVLTRALHQGKNLNALNAGDPPDYLIGEHFGFELYPDPQVNDFMNFFCRNVSNFHVHIYPARDAQQTIVMPTESWTGTATYTIDPVTGLPTGAPKYIDLDNNAGSYNSHYNGQNMLTLACDAPNHWICVASTHSLTGTIIPE